MATQRTHIPKVGVISLGCPKNLVDSQRLMSALVAKGYNLTDESADADLVLVNTCGFIEPAVEESFQAIYEAREQCQKVVVMGCLGAQKQKVLDEFPDVDAVIGPGRRATVLRTIKKLVGEPPALAQQSVPASGVLLTPDHYAYLKVAEGCRHHCSFCIIPDLRGSLSSRPIESCFQEAQDLVARNVRELLVIAQDSSDYGFDLKDGSDIIKLCQRLAQLSPRPWIRLHYVYPNKNVEDLVRLMADGLILPYLDIPLQHSSERILKLMKRPGNIERTYERIMSWREICPDITIRSNFITGFPGETEKEFNELLDFVAKARLDRVGTFPYSDVEGAQANDYDGEVPEEVRIERAQQLMELQAQISKEKLAQRVGKEMEMIVDHVAETGEITARTKYEAPDIDGQVYVSPIQDSKVKVQAGDIILGRITKTDEHDMWADYVSDITVRTHIPFKIK